MGDRDTKQEPGGKAVRESVRDTGRHEGEQEPARAEARARSTHQRTGTKAKKQDLKGPQIQKSPK